MWTLCFAAVVSVFFFLLLHFFLAYSQRLQSGCLPCFHTWCGFSVNLECKCEMCCTRLAGNTGHKKYAKHCHLCTIAQLCQAISSQLTHLSTIGKNLLDSNISFTHPQNMVNFDPLAAEIIDHFGHLIKFQRVSHLSFLNAPTPLNRGQPNFARCLAISWAGTLYIHFRGFLPLTEFCQLQSSLCIQVLCSHILVGLLHGTQAVGISQTAAFSRGYHLHLAPQPSRSASAHILVYYVLMHGMQQMTKSGYKHIDTVQKPSQWN